MKSEVRIDKWMWAVRLFKTRSLAADACKKSKVFINGSLAKPSRNIKVGDVTQIRRGPITYSFQVLALCENRMGAKLVSNYMKNVTSKDQLDLIELQKLNKFAVRDRGAGRPTKKERREIESYAEELTFIDEDWNFDFSEENDI